MPVYEYACEECGPFTALRPMSEYDQPCACPDCETSSKRVMLTAPHLASMNANKRNAMAVNERSSHEPISSKSLGHGPNCGCCGSKSKKSKAKVSASGAKSFPSARPWMISH